MLRADEHITRYPLVWPAGWRRAEIRKRAQFNSSGRPLSVIEGVNRVRYEMARLGIDDADVVISTNIPTRLDGLPRSDRGESGDPGVALYWRTAQSKHPKCMALDRYERTADNLAAIASTLDAMRAIERHGSGAILDRVFMGFTALPAPEQPFQVLGVPSTPTQQQVDEAYRKLASRHHPDKGGDEYQMARINSARDDLYAQMGWT